MTIWPRTEHVGEVVTRFGKTYISVESGPDTCKGCAAESTYSANGIKKYNSANALCDALPSCRTVVWKEYKDGEMPC